MRMKHNPILRSLGFDARARVVIIHADDIGMCDATILALDAIFNSQFVTSISLMPPAPAFAEAVALCRAHPQADAGVHLTLTGELATQRWRPLTSADASHELTGAAHEMTDAAHEPTDAARGLADANGYLPRTARALAERAAPFAGRAEMHAQLACAVRAGVDVTHLDTHMFTCFAPRFLAPYLELAGEFQLPALLPRFDETIAGLKLRRACGLVGDELSHVARIVAEWEARGGIVFDQLAWLPLNQPEERIAQAKKIIDAAPAGLTHFLIHPASDTAELRAVAPGSWRARVADYQAFTGDELRRYVKDSGVQLLGYRALRDALRRPSPADANERKREAFI